MAKTVVIHQPDFVSYLGFFHKLLYADLYVVLDNVQYVSRSWMNRDQIMTQTGKKWLTVNIKKASRSTTIDKIKLDDTQNWKKQNLNLLKENYRKSAFFNEIYPFIEKLYSNKCKYLYEFNMESIYMLIKLFNIHIDIEYSSNLITTKTKSERLVEILTQVDATHYLSGIGAKAYHDDTPFDKANIKVIWQNFQHPTYPQVQGKGEFIPYLSSIDLLFNCGTEHSRKILREI